MPTSAPPTSTASLRLAAQRLIAAIRKRRPLAASGRYPLLHGQRISEMEASVQADCVALGQELEWRRAALAELGEIRSLLSGATSPRARSSKARKSGRLSNADLVVTTLAGLGGIQRADTVVAAVKSAHPTFGGASYRTQIYQILSRDPRVLRLGRGQYRLHPNPRR